MGRLLREEVQRRGGRGEGLVEGLFELTYFGQMTWQAMRLMKVRSVWERLLQLRRVIIFSDEYEYSGKCCPYHAAWLK